MVSATTARVWGSRGCVLREVENGDAGLEQSAVSLADHAGGRGACS